jgi:hypothetical protein
MYNPISEKECIDILTQMGVQVFYSPRVLLPETRGGEVVEMSVFEAVDRLNTWNQTNKIIWNTMNQK